MSSAPRPPNRRLQTRLLRHHLPLLAGVLVLVALVAVLAGGKTVVFRLSMGTAYVGLALLAVTLALGPLRALRRRPLPLSLDLRRDLGIWAGIVGIAHAGVGLFVHLGNPVHYFFDPQGSGLPRVDPFGLTNYAGLFAVLVLAALLATSNDASLRRLGGQRWKGLHRWVYGGAAVVVGHGALYQILESRVLPFVLLFGALAAALALVQGLGYLARRQHRQALQANRAG